jgi:acetyl-CoA acetyltransferase
MKAPMTIDDHHNSRWIAEPLRLLDCCLVSSGAVAAIVTSSEHARDLKQPPVHVLGYATCAPGDNLNTARQPAVETGAKRSGEMAFRMAGITRDDIGTCQLYDCYTYTVLVKLEDYGFCAKGEGGPLVADGKLGPGGSLPTNPAVVSCPVTTCGHSHRCPRPWCRFVARAARVRCHATIMCWSAAMAAF